MMKKLAALFFVIAFAFVLSGIWSLSQEEAGKCFLSAGLFCFTGWCLGIVSTI